MFSAPTETYVAWMTWLLLAGAALAATTGVITLARARRMRYFHVRRDAVLRGWQRLMAAVALFIGSGLVAGLGTPAIRLAVRPTASPTASLTPSASVPPPSPTASATASATASRTATAGPTPTATASATPTVSPTPQLPRAFITPILTATVTPPAGATVSPLRFSLRDDCAATRSQAYFDQLPKRLYAHFTYDNWLPGQQWSGVWLRDGQVIHVETGLWDGSTGGCGFTEFHPGEWWKLGAYEVQIFAGDRWLGSGRFEIVSATPTGTTTPTRTPRTPSPTPPATLTRTPRPPTAPATRTAVPSATVLPFDVQALAVIVVQPPTVAANLRASAPDGEVLAILEPGTEVEVLRNYTVVNGTQWWEIRLANGRTGWIAGYFLKFTLTR